MAYHVGKDLRHWAPISVNCTCLRVRKAALALTNHFESYLAPLNINSTQYSILTVLDILEGSSVCQLAEIIAMPRKTLTRHLKPLETRELISIEQGFDKREKTVTISDAGADLIKQGRPLWELAQSDMVERLGRQGWRQTHELLEVLATIND